MKNIWKSKAANQRAFISETGDQRAASVCVERKVINSILDVTSSSLAMGDVTNMAGWGEKRRPFSH